MKLYCKYEWDDRHNKFRLVKGESSHRLQLTKDTRSIITDVVRTVETRSGIRDRVEITLWIVFFIAVGVMYGISYYLLVNSVLGGVPGKVMLAISPFVCYSLFGWRLIRGSRLSRVNRWIKDNEMELKERLVVLGLDVAIVFFLIDPNDVKDIPEHLRPKKQSCSWCRGKEMRGALEIYDKCPDLPLANSKSKYKQKKDQPLDDFMKPHTFTSLVGGESIPSSTIQNFHHQNPDSAPSPAPPIPIIITDPPLPTSQDIVNTESEQALTSRSNQPLVSIADSIDFTQFNNNDRDRRFNEILKNKLLNSDKNTFKILGGTNLFK